MKKLVKKDLLTYDMVHNNPGMESYESRYNSSKFLKERGYNGKVFDLFQCAQYGLLWDELDNRHPEREKVFPDGSKGRCWVLEKRGELKRKYQETKSQGLEVMFMMDIIVLPERLQKLYPEILTMDRKIDICNPNMREVLDLMFDEMFSSFPEIDGIYIRFGETYAGERFGTPYHYGNNPILRDAERYHIFLIQYLQEKVCNQYQRKIYYRSWGFGEFQYNPEYYLRISESIETNPRFYFCIKHTQGDFHRTVPFNQCLNIGKHKQIIEVQAAREYEGKGAYPNYIGDGLINGYEEFKWLMSEDEAQSLKDVICCKDSLICGIWTWSRGGGWDGPYINGKNGVNGTRRVENGCELWADVNAYVITQWAKNTVRSDKYYAKQYAKKELKMSEYDSELFYEILLFSSKAVLLGRGTNTSAFKWDVFWTRDQNIEYARVLANIKSADEADALDLMLAEQRRSVEIWREIVHLAESLTDGSEKKEYIITTCKYGYYLYRLYEIIYRANVLAYKGGQKNLVEMAVREYDEVWKAWEELYQTAKGCPTMYAKEDTHLDMIGYDWNSGMDSAINPLRVLDENGKILQENQVEVLHDNGWGLR